MLSVTFRIQCDVMNCWCVCTGVPFRETHHISGAAVKMAEDRNVTLFDLSVADLKTIHPLFEDDVLEVFFSPPCHHLTSHAMSEI